MLYFLCVADEQALLEHERQLAAQLAQLPAAHGQQQPDPGIPWLLEQQKQQQQEAQQQGQTPEAQLPKPLMDALSHLVQQGRCAGWLAHPSEVRRICKVLLSGADWLTGTAGKPCSAAWQRQGRGAWCRQR